MLKSIGILVLCWACLPQTRLRSVDPQPPAAGLKAPADSLTAIERVRIVEAAMRFRRMILIDDTATRLDGCSVGVAVGRDYRTLLVPVVRELVVEPASGCGPNPSDVIGVPRLLRLRSIQGSGDTAVANLTYLGGSTDTHEEEFKVKRASTRPDGLWAATEMRAYGALIID